MSQHHFVHPSACRIPVTWFKYISADLFVNWKAKQDSFSATEMLDKSLQHSVKTAFQISPVRIAQPSQPKDYFPRPKTRAVNQCCPAHFRAEMLIYLGGKVTSLAQLSTGQVPQRLKPRALFFSKNFEQLFFRNIRTVKPDCVGFSGAGSVFWDMFGKSEKSLQSYQAHIFYTIHFRVKGCRIWFWFFSPRKFVKEAV